MHSYLNNLIQPVNQRILRRHLDRATSIRPCVQVLLQLFLVQAEQLRQLVGISLGRLGLTIEDGSDSNFLTTDGFGELGESDLLGLFGGEEGMADGGEAGGEGGLDDVALACDVVDLECVQEVQCRWHTSRVATGLSNEPSIG
jgi:hypothetical protein